MSLFKRHYKEFRIVPYNYGRWGVQYRYRFLFGLIKYWSIARLPRYSFSSITNATKMIISQHPYENLKITKGFNDVVHYIQPKKKNK